MRRVGVTSYERDHAQKVSAIHRRRCRCSCVFILIFSPNLGEYSGVSTGQLVATWRGSKWLPVSSCSVRVLSHSPKANASGWKYIITDENTKIISRFTPHAPV